MLADLAVEIEARTMAPAALSEFVANAAAAERPPAEPLTPDPAHERRAADVTLAAAPPQPALAPLWSPKARAVAGVLSTAMIQDGRRCTLGYTSPWTPALLTFDGLELDLAVLEAGVRRAAAC